jgi:hypothetical protein
MRRHGLLVTTASTVLVTGLILPQLGWFIARPLRGSPPRSADTYAHTKSREALLSEAAFRWRQCQPSHWRAWVLQH